MMRDSKVEHRTKPRALPFARVLRCSRATYERARALMTLVSEGLQRAPKRVARWRRAMTKCVGARGRHRSTIVRASRRRKKRASREKFFRDVRARASTQRASTRYTNRLSRDQDVGARFCKKARKNRISHRIHEIRGF
jgi:hypothetical protein